MDDLAARLLVRDSLRRKLSFGLTPSERLDDMARLQQVTWDLLRASPQGYAHFLRRNFKARAVPVRGSDAT